MSVANFNRLIDNLHQGRGKGGEVLSPSDLGLENINLKTGGGGGETNGTIINVGGMTRGIFIVQFRFGAGDATAGSFGIRIHLFDEDDNQLNPNRVLSVFNDNQVLEDDEWILAVGPASSKVAQIGGTDGNFVAAWPSASRARFVFRNATASDDSTSATANVYLIAH